MKKSPFIFLFLLACSDENSPSRFDRDTSDLSEKDQSFVDMQADLAKTNRPKDMKTSIDAEPQIDADKTVDMEAADMGKPDLGQDMPPFSCDSQPPILNGAEDRSIIANNSSRPGVYNGRFDAYQQTENPVPWPGRVGESIRLSLSANQYISSFFVSQNETQTGRFQIALSGNFEGPPTRATSISISRCPGDFSVHLGQASCLSTPAAISNLRWSTDPNADGTRNCILEKNSEYYFNIVHAKPANNFSDTACRFDYCGVLAQQVY